MTVTINGNGTITPVSAVQPAGSILQVQQSSNNTATGYFDLTSNSDYYDFTNMNVAITPASSSNKILVSCMAFGEGDDPEYQFRWRIKRVITGGATTYIQGPAAGSRIQCMGMVPTAYFDAIDNNTTPMHFGCSNYLDNPSTTSAVTYTFQMNSNGNNHKWYYNRTVTDSDTAPHERGLSYITVMEVAG